MGMWDNSALRVLLFCTASHEVVAETLSDAMTFLNGEDGMALLFDSEGDFATTGFPGSAAIVGGGSQDGYDSSPDAAASSLLTYTSASPKMLMGPSGTLRFQANNLLQRSESFDTGSYWFPTNTTVSANTTTAPDGTSTADSLLETADAGIHQLYASSPVATGPTYTIAVYMKPNGRSYGSLALGSNLWASFDFTGSGSVVKTVGATASISAVANGWFLCSVSGVGASGDLCLISPADAAYSGGDSFGRASYTGDITKGLYLWGAHLRRTPSDSTYLATTSAARYALPFEFSTAGVLQGIRVEEARTNLCLYSDDLTNAAWTKSNMTTAKTATGPDGVANSATTCTATAGNATALQAITSGSAARITSCYIKRRTGTGNIDLTQDNGSTWTTVTVTSDWTRVNLSSVTSTNPTVGIRVVTSGDAVDIALFQHEVGNSISSPIPTIGSAVTRLVDNISLATSAFPYNNSISTFFAYGSATPSAAGNYPTLIGSSSPGVEYSRVEASATVIGATSGTLYAFCTIGSSGNANANEIKSASAFATNDAAIAANGGTVGTDVSGSPASAPTSIVIGSRIGDSQLWGGLIKQIAYFPARKSNAELQTLTT